MLDAVLPLRKMLAVPHKYAPKVGSQAPPVVGRPVPEPRRLFFAGARLRATAGQILVDVEPVTTRPNSSRVFWFCHGALRPLLCVTAPHKAACGLFRYPVGTRLLPARTVCVATIFSQRSCISPVHGPYGIAAAFFLPHRRKPAGISTKQPAVLLRGKGLTVAYREFYDQTKPTNQTMRQCHHLWPFRRASLFTRK